MSRNDGRRDGAPDPSSAPPRDETVDDILRAIARSPPRSLRPELLPGQRLKDRYVVERRIGAGGMGTVYAARDELLEKVVALKVLHPVPDEEPGASRARITREARLAARVEHERIARVYDFGEQEGSCFVVMEFVEGITLRAWMAKDSRLGLQLGSILRGIAEGLGALHKRGVAHGDLKPENVMLRDDRRVKLLDFGLARTIADSTLQSGPAAIADLPSLSSKSAAWAGTLGYVAPERLFGAPLQPQADVFALGVILFECIAGRRPFESGDPASFLRAVERGPDFLDSSWGSLPRLTATAKIMLAATPDQRFANGSEALTALEASSASDASGSTPRMPLPWEGHTILWVDDRPADNRAERAAFESMGFEIERTTSTETALHDLHQATFAAVISNEGSEVFPRTGYFLLEAMRSRGDETPFFLYSVDALERIKEIFIRGGQGAVNDEAQLVQAVTSTLGRKRRGHRAVADTTPPFIARVVHDRISVRCANIVTLDVDAIVSPTDSTMRGDGGGVCGEIRRSGGVALRDECNALEWCAVGDAKITRGHRLRARYVIHAVGARWSGDDSNEERLLESCYARVFALAQENGLRTIATPCISAGGRGYPVVPAARIAVRSTAKALASSPVPESVILCDASPTAADAMQAALDAWTLG